jgi:hypothetical protein
LEAWMCEELGKYDWENTVMKFGQKMASGSSKTISQPITHNYKLPEAIGR